MDDPQSERLERVEAALAHLERLFEELNQVVVEQAKVLARLQAQQKQVTDTVTTLELERIRSTQVKPPHYQ